MNTLTNKDKEFLTKNKMLRMDANLHDIFDRTRCNFHYDRYRFACEYTEDKIVLDCASGLGYGADIISKFGRAKNVIGIELDSDAVDYSNRIYGNNSIKFIQGSILDLPIKDESIDVFTSFETIEHVDNEELQLKEINRVLKPNGLYIVSTPNDWDNSVNPYHVKQYTYQNLLESLSNKFEILKVYNQNSGTPNRQENHNQQRSIYITTEENNHLAECFIVVCRKKS